MRFSIRVLMLWTAVWFLGGATGRAAEPSCPFLQTLVNTDGGVTIAYGTDPQSEEAAKIIQKAALAIQGAEDGKNVKLVKAEEFDAADFPVTGQTHVIAVGTLVDNAALRGRNWLPTWWLDRDWYYTQYKYAVQPDQALSYQPTSGFVAGGFGEWAKGEARIGLIEVDRSEYFMEWLVRSRYEKAAGGKIVNGNHESWHKLNEMDFPTYPTDFPLRLMVRVAGSGGPGVVAAARAFAERGLLGGVVLAEGAAADPGPTMFTLPADRYADHLPFTPPAGANGYVYQGWLMASAFEYDGFHHDAGVSPRMMYRVKYKPEAGITNFWTTPHRRASQFEICVVSLASHEDAVKAETNLKATLAATPGGKEDRIKGFSMVVTDNVLLLESLPEPAGKAILDQFAKLGLK